MLPFEDRYSRQRSLPEVGPLGQERLANARIRLPQREGAEFAKLYLKRAGVGGVEQAPALVPDRAWEFPHATAFHHIESQRLACGAWSALQCIANLLEIDRDPPT